MPQSTKIDRKKPSFPALRQGSARITYWIPPEPRKGGSNFRDLGNPVGGFSREARHPYGRCFFAKIDFSIFL